MIIAILLIVVIIAILLIVVIIAIISIVVIRAAAQERKMWYRLYSVAH